MQERRNYDYAFIMHSAKEVLKARLKELREKRNLTQEKLAELVDVSPKAISHYETGRACPINHIDELALALDVEPYKLFKGNYLLLSEDELIARIVHMIKNLPREKLVDVFKIIESLYS